MLAGVIAGLARCSPRAAATTTTVRRRDRRRHRRRSRRPRPRRRHAEPPPTTRRRHRPRCRAGHDGRPATTAAADAPQRIVSLSPTPTEMLFAIGAGDQVVAVDDFSNYPAGGGRGDAPTCRLTSPTSRRSPATSPTSSSPTARNPDVRQPARLARHRALGGAGADGRSTTSTPRSSSSARRPATSAEAAELVGQMQADIDDDRSPAMPALDAPLTYYHELDHDATSASPRDTFIGQVYIAARAAQHRRRGRGHGRRVPAAQRRVHHLDRPRPDLPRRHQVLRRDAPRRWPPAPAGTRSPRCSNGGVVAMDDDIAVALGPAHRRLHRQRVADAREPAVVGRTA